MIRNLLLCLFLFPCFSFSQEVLFNISGKITSDDQQPLPFVNVVLLRAGDSTLVKAGITDITGFFVLEDIRKGTYFLQAALVGYSRYSGPVIEVNAAHDAGSIIMKKAGTDLKEVNITVIKPFVEHRFEKTIVNVENSIVNAGSSAMEVLQRSPGVIIGQADDIMLKGRSGTVVMIDGKPSPLSGEALAAMLRALPANAVSKIELITNPSAKYDAEGNAGIINIIMKKNSGSGTSGSLNASAGTGRYGKASAGFSLSHRNEKWNLYSSFNYAHREGFNSTTHIRNFHSNGLLDAVYSQDIYASLPSDSYIPRLGAECKISSGTTAGVQLSGMVNNIATNADNRTYIYDSQEMPAGNFNTISHTANAWNNFNGNFNFRHVFDTLGRELTADIDYSHYLNDNNQLFTTRNFDKTGLLLDSTVLRGDQHGLLDIYALKADYTHPVKNMGTLEAGIKVSYVETDNNLQYFNRIGPSDFPDSSNSNHFIYSENIRAAYMKLSRERDKLNMQAGIRVEQTLATGHQLSNDSLFTRSYLQPFFSLAASYRFNEKHEAALSLSRRISRPNYQQLNPFRRYVDQTTYGAGNPFLLPALTWSTELSYTFRQSLSFTAGYSYTKDDIETAFLQEDISRITLQTEVNIHAAESYSLSVNFTRQPVSWFQTSSDLQVYQSRYMGYLSGSYLNRSRPSFYFNTTNTFVLPHDFSFELSGFYQYRLIAGMLDIRDAWEAGAGVQKKMVKNRMIVKFNITDIFRQNLSAGSAHFANVDSRFTAMHETRVATLSFVYNFGRGGAQVKKRSSSEEERGRVKTG